MTDLNPVLKTTFRAGAFLATSTFGFTANEERQITLHRLVQLPEGRTVEALLGVTPSADFGCNITTVGAHEWPLHVTIISNNTVGAGSDRALIGEHLPGSEGWKWRLPDFADGQTMTILTSQFPGFCVGGDMDGRALVYACHDGTYATVQPGSSHFTRVSSQVDSSSPLAMDEKIALWTVGESGEHPEVYGWAPGLDAQLKFTVNGRMRGLALNPASLAGAAGPGAQTTADGVVIPSNVRLFTSSRASNAIDFSPPRYGPKIPWDHEYYYHSQVAAWGPFIAVHLGTQDQIVLARTTDWAMRIMPHPRWGFGAGYCFAMDAQYLYSCGRYEDMSVYRWDLSMFEQLGVPLQ